MASTHEGGHFAMSSNAIAIATEVLFREALYLDTQRWDEWTGLFTEECEYWVPAWKGEHAPTEDPRREISLIYYAKRAGLEDRIWRARSNRSVASFVLPRTQHAVTNILLGEPSSETRISVQANFTTHQFSPKEKTVEIFFGRYEHTLVLEGTAWRIARKKIILLNDYLPAKVDVYSL
jgi:3-phenylpropionate/cinnamic acid dioxygenase small subunit